jgi:aminopeptidase
LVREFGLGLNPAMGKHSPLNDVTAFERQVGLHMSLGRKHTVFKKPTIISQKSARFHLDLFVDVEEIRIDDDPIFSKARGFLLD